MVHGVLLEWGLLNLKITTICVAHCLFRVFNHKLLGWILTLPADRGPQLDDERLCPCAPIGDADEPLFSVDSFPRASDSETLVFGDLYP
eukprot:7806421-Prorocentrum_lima.AAC.1